MAATRFWPSRSYIVKHALASAEPVRSAAPALEGFRYQPDLLSEAEAQDLIAHLTGLDFRPFEFRGYLGKRRVVYFGWRYDFNHTRLDRAEPIPAFLDELRGRAAAFAGLDPDCLEHVLINEYAPGAGIGWHKDRPQFEDVIGVSLGSPGLLRSGGSAEAPGSASRSPSRRAPPICCEARRAPSGSTAFPRWMRSASPSPSGL